MLQRQQELGRQQPSPHPTAAHVWLAVLSPLTANGQRTEEIVHENDEGDRVTASGHGELPGEQGNENTVDGIRSGQKKATGHAESGIDPRIETSLPESESNLKIVTAKTTASDALARLTANGKRSESENDGHGHESCPTESGLYDPSLFLDPKIGNHGRIEKRSSPPKLLSTHHVTERAVMSGE